MSESLNLAGLFVVIVWAFTCTFIPASCQKDSLNNPPHRQQFFFNRSVCRETARLILNFPCQEHGRCIRRELICDGIKHCINGIDDLTYNEKIHGQSDEGIRCRIKNSNKFCFLPSMYRCDGIGHCHNNADECDCGESSAFFKCGENECVHNSTLCDGVVDCSNGADERMLNKNSSVILSSDVKCKTPQGNVCLLYKEFACDGHVHCHGNTDECSCANSDYYRCSDDQCVHKSAVCNGKKECDNGMDEQYSITISIGPSGYLKSSNSSGMYCYPNTKKGTQACLLPSSMICDGISHCRGAVDECADELCVEHRSKYHKCGADYQCVKTSQVCDNKKQCANGDDEQGIEPSYAFDNRGYLIHNTSSGFKCPSKSSECLLPTAHVCDGVAHCRANVDECNCPNTTYSFNCGNGECLDFKNFCNLNSQCSNGRDELPYSPNSEGFRCLQYNSKLSYRVCDLPQEFVCDGIHHCYDSADERVCKGDYVTSRNFKCLDGRRVVSFDQLCDDIINCLDMSDECEICGNQLPICNRICGTNDSAECIPKEAVCDGVVEYDVDELYCAGTAARHQHPYEELYGHNISQILLCCNDLGGCQNSSTYSRDVCEKSLFKCPKSKKSVEGIGIGIPEFAIANDGIMSCHHGEDECNGTYDRSLIPAHRSSNLTEEELHYFRCALASDDKAFGSEICNGKFRGANDEAYCSDDVRFKCQDTTSDPVNVHESKKCDLRSDCFDSSDEANCPKETHFYCNDSNEMTEENRKKKGPIKTVFIPRSKVCDGREDCRGGNDECQSCYPSPFSDDNRLISSVFLRVLVWLSALVAIFGNTFALLETGYNFYRNHQKMDLFPKNSKVQLLSLSVADLLVGIYLLSVAISDITLGKYCSASRRWRASPGCNVMGVIGFVGSQVSVFSMLLLTLSRYITIKNPFLRFRVRYSVVAIAFIWFCGFLMALIPISQGTKDYFVTSVAYNDTKYWPLVSRIDNSKFLNKISLKIKPGIRPILENSFRGDVENSSEHSWHTIFKAMQELEMAPEYEYGYYSTHGVCISNLYPNTELDKSWAYTTFVMILNFLVFIGIAITYFLIYRYTSLKANRVSAKKTNPVLERLQKRISIIIITDFCCWIPICVTSFIAVSGSTIPGVMFAITAIVILPINSALNPIIYSSIPEKIQDKVIKPLKEKFGKPQSPKADSESSKSTRMTSVKSTVAQSVMLLFHICSFCRYF